MKLVRCESWNERIDIAFRLDISSLIECIRFKVHIVICLTSAQGSEHSMSNYLRCSIVHPTWHLVAIAPFLN